MSQEIKKCNNCSLDKSIDKFRKMKHPRGYQYRCSMCSDCEKAKNKEYREKTRKLSRRKGVYIILKTRIKYTSNNKNISSKQKKDGKNITNNTVKLTLIKLLSVKKHGIKTTKTR